MCHLPAKWFPTTRRPAFETCVATPNAQTCLVGKNRSRLCGSLEHNTRRFHRRWPSCVVGLLMFHPTFFSVNFKILVDSLETSEVPSDSCNPLTFHPHFQSQNTERLTSNLIQACCVANFSVHAIIHTPEHSSNCNPITTVHSAKKCPSLRRQFLKPL